MTQRKNIAMAAMATYIVLSLIIFITVIVSLIAGHWLMPIIPFAMILAAKCIAFLTTIFTM